VQRVADATGEAFDGLGEGQMVHGAQERVHDWFRAQLSSPEADAGRRFLGERGFDAGAAAHFGVGYAPKGWDGLRARNQSAAAAFAWYSRVRPLVSGAAPPSS
jgi:DNA primase